MHLVLMTLLSLPGVPLLAHFRFLSQSFPLIYFYKKNKKWDAPTTNCINYLNYIGMKEWFATENSDVSRAIVFRYNRQIIKYLQGFDKVVCNYW